MKFEFSAEDESFRHEVRAFFEQNLPRDISDDIRRWTNPQVENYRRWQRILAAKGWAAPHWPPEWGGTDWSAIRKHIYMDELYRADAPDFFWQGTHMLAPVLIAFGSQQQRLERLPRILNGEDCWCQGFSEPNAGSDLVNLRTTAVLQGDEYVLNGQKIWTSDARESDWGFFLVRTDATVKPQRGLSFIMAKMDTPGISIRPIRSIDGRNELNEVFLDNVRVPRDYLIGEPGLGWTYAKYLLEKERTASAFLYFNKRNLAKAKSIARRIRVDGMPLMDTPQFSERVARVEADLVALEWSVLRILSQDKYRYDLNAVVSALKIRGSEMQQRVTQLQVDALGALALRRFVREEMHAGEFDSIAALPPDTVGASSQYLFQRAATIYGGAREVQKISLRKLRSDSRPMDFNLSDEQKMLREGAERYLSENYDFDKRRLLIAQEGGFSVSQWRQFAEMGWLALAIPEDCGGLGGSFVDISLIQEALGGRLVLEPYASTTILGAFLIDGCESAELRSTALQSIAAGELRVALAYAEDESRYDLTKVGVRAARGVRGYELSGRKIAVWDVASAQRLIVSAVLDGDSRASLFWVERPAAGLRESLYPLIDSTYAADFEFAGVPAKLLLAAQQAVPRLEQAVDRLLLARVAETLGIMEKVLEITAEQLRNRAQFGQPLSKFQALQHRMAEMFVEVQETRSILYYGLAMIDAPPAERATAVSTAKVVATGAAQIVGAQGIQLHGGVGMTDEYAVGHYFKRLLALEKQYGDMDYHLRRIAMSYRKDQR